jgi:hypothetical protein
MAFQSLNIIGSFLVGVPAVQREVSADRERVEAYRSLMRQQVQLGNRSSTDDVNDIESPDKMVVGDAPEEQRNPYLFVRYPKSTVENTSEPVEESTPSDDDQHLDVLL